MKISEIAAQKNLEQRNNEKLDIAQKLLGLRATAQAEASRFGQMLDLIDNDKLELVQEMLSNNRSMLERASGYLNKGVT